MSLRESLASGQLHGHRQDLFGVLSKRWVFVALTIVPALAVFGFVNMFPMLWALAASFFEVGAFQPSWNWAGLANFEAVISSADFWASIRRSVLFAAGSVALQVTTGTALAALLDRTFSFKRIIRAIALVPYIVPTAVLSFVALWMGNPRYGIINQLLVDFGVLSEFIAWYGTTDLAMLSVIVTSSWKFTIFVTIIVLARLQSIPASIYEAATVSGASRWQRFKDITLPNLKGVLFIVVLLRGVWMFNKFDIIFILTNGGPVNSTTTASIYAYRTAFSDFNLGEAAAVSTLLFVLLVGAAAVYFYFFEPSQEVRVE